MGGNFLTKFLTSLSLFCYIHTQGPVTIVSFRTDTVTALHGNHSITRTILNCTIQGHPSSVDILRLEDKKLMASRAEDQGQTRIYKPTHYLSCEDMGIYVCEARTSVQALRKVTNLVVPKCRPVLCQGETTNKTVFAALKETKMVSFCVLANPSLSLYAQLDGEHVRQTTDQKVSLTWHFDPGQENNTFIVHVIISNISLLDYGHINVTVFSSAGNQYKMTHVIDLQPSGPPECPSNLTILHQEPQYVTLSWTPGLSRGADQSYYVFYFTNQNPANWEIETDQENGWTCLQFGDLTRINITGLQAGNRYTVTVTSANDYTSEEVNQTWCQRNSIRFYLPGPPDCPTNVTCSGQEENGLLVSWTPGRDKGSNQSFHLFYRSRDTWKRQDVPEGRTWVKIKNLQAKTNYSFTVVSSSVYRPEINPTACLSNIIYFYTPGQREVISPVTIIVLTSGVVISLLPLVIFLVCQANQSVPTGEENIRAADEENIRAADEDHIYESIGEETVDDAAISAQEITRGEHRRISSYEVTCSLMRETYPEYVQEFEYSRSASMAFHDHMNQCGCIHRYWDVWSEDGTYICPTSQCTDSLFSDTSMSLSNQSTHSF